jgi:DNA polymerase IIIc chi subunit
MNSSESTRVIFFQVSQPTAKVNKLVEIAQYHFSRKEHLLIIADEERALAFVDELFWSHTPEIFLPHAIFESETEEWIVLTKIKKNLNHARFVFNLCSTPLLIEGPFRLIYDYEDMSSPSKKNLSAARFDAYKQAHFLIESRN